jgi:hypothetical protein
MHDYKLGCVISESLVTKPGRVAKLWTDGNSSSLEEMY